MSFLTSRTLRTPSTLTPLLRQSLPSTRRHLARLTIVGRLGDSPELQATSTGNEVVRYNIATSHGPKDNRQTSWWKVTSFAPEGGLRDALLGLGKGSKVFVEGDASINKYSTSDGTARESLNIIQKNVEILERRSTAPAEDEPSATAAAGAQ